MPVEVIEAPDPMTNMVRFQTSAIYELVIGLQALLNRSNKRPEWVQRAHAALPPDFWAEVAALYGPFGKGIMFFELAVDYPDHDDVPGFIDSVRMMDPVDFIFYVVGRIIPREAIAATGLDHDALRAALQQSSYYTQNCMCEQAPLDMLLADVPAFQGRLADLWARAWDEFFASQMGELAAHWGPALDDKSALLARLGGEGLFEHVSGKSQLPALLPPDYPVSEVVFVPVYLIGWPVLMFYGYGNVTVLFDSERTEARQVEVERNKEQALAILKALGDNSRLEILRLVARYEGEIHGKKIAAHLNLSASAVSRHLNQLKDAGLIVEDSQDNRTIPYRLQREAITALPDRLLDYLYH